ncbi:MAG: beta-lactamase family protein [Ferrovibrio sp.]|uniref:serine hydrolase domain-containing protein n=1 Tax=Ferrovibrio sp. TaxID=1917215 RepID=UPI002612D94C|nr:serine hydrolase domain-containing protein [Ferrovibrio sp.]MCW0232941.1 beta-lactamase family protein [Ferrovibrio sp.]
MKPDWLKPALDYIPRWMEFQMEAWQRPGCVIAIARHGRIIFEQAFGVASLKTGEKLTPRHRFRVASHSKSYTAAGILKLREQGRLKLDDSIGQHLPGRLHKATARVTLQQLLSHSAGLRRDGRDSGYFADTRPFPTAEEVLRDLEGAPLIEPNTRFKYSNLGYALLGLVIEQITGQRYADWMTAEILRPLGLDETLPDMPARRSAKRGGALPKPGLMHGHSGRLLLGRRVVIPCDQPLHALAPVGGFVATASDLALFYNHLSPDAKRSVISIDSRRELMRKQWSVPHSSMGGEYGLGTIIGRFNGWEWFGHTGGLQGFISRAICVPSQGLSIAVLCNSLDGLNGPWVDGILQILQTFAQRGAARGRTDGWSGRWWGLWGACDLVPMGDRVLVAGPGFMMPFSDASEIAVTGRNTGRIVLANGYGSHGESVELKRDARGKVTEVSFAGGKMTSRAKMAAEISKRYEGKKR